MAAVVVKSSQRIESDIDEHSRVKTDAKNVIKEALDTLSNKDDKVIAAFVKRKFDEKYGPTWHCIVGDDFKAAISHESKTYIFVAMGKSNVLLYRCG